MSDQCIQISKLLDRASSHIPSHTWPHLFLILSPAHATLRALVEGRHRLVSRSYLQLLEVRAAICAFWTIGIRLVSILPSLCAPEHVVDSLVLQRHLAAHCGFQLVCIRARLAIEAHHAIRILEQQKVAAQWTEMHGGGGGRRRRRGASSSATPPWMAPRASTRAERGDYETCQKLVRNGHGLKKTFFMPRHPPPHPTPPPVHPTLT